MISKVKKYLAVVMLSMLSTVVVAQIDPHFSQYYMYPLWLNPALTGAVDGNYRVSVIDRQQWSNIAPFKTTGISGDMTTKKNINFGVNVLQQTAGDVGYKYSTGDLSISYSGIRFGKEGDKVLTFGMQGGFLGRSIDLSAAQVDAQYQEGGGYNSALPTNLAITKPSAYAFDMGAGLFYYDADPDKKTNLFGGFSAGHITQPNNPFLSSSTGAKLPIRYTVHGGANIYLSEKAQLVPNVLYMQQGNSTEIMLGGYVQMALNETSDITGGVNYRVNDAIAPYIGLKLSDFTFGFSYDVNSSQLGKVVNGTSGFDLSLMYTDSKKQKGYFKCPRY